MIGRLVVLILGTVVWPVYAQDTPSAVGETWYAVVGMGGVLILAWVVTRLVAQPILVRLREAEQASATLVTESPPGLSPLTDMTLAAGEVHVDLLTRRATVADEEMTLTSTEFDLLRYLLQHQGQALSRADLLREVWGHQQPVYSRTVDTHVQRLRDKLGPARDQLETVRGVGYRLNAPVVA